MGTWPKTHTKETREKVHRIIQENHKAGLSARDTVKHLKSEGLKRPSGGLYEERDVYSLRNQLKKKTSRKRKKAKRLARSSGAVVRKRPSVDRRAPDGLPEIISKILSSDKTDDEKLRLIERAKNGDLFVEETPKFEVISRKGKHSLLIFVTSPLGDVSKEPAFSMGPKRARIILQSVEEIEDFLEKHGS